MSAPTTHYLEKVICDSEFLLVIFWMTAYQQSIKLFMIFPISRYAQLS